MRAHLIGFLALCILLTALAAPAYADDSDPERRLNGGLLLGVNISNSFGTQCTLDCDLDAAMFGFEDFDPAATLRTSDHVTVGGFLTYQLRPRYGLRVEARLSTKGVKAEHVAPVVLFDEVDGMDVPRFALINYTLEHKLRYLQVPIMVQRDIAYDNRFKPHVMAGFSLGYLWTSSAEGEGNIIDAESFSTIGTVTGDGDTSDVARAFDVSVVIGADMVFPIARGAIELGVRFEQSVLRSIDGSFANQLSSSQTLYQPIAASPASALEVTSTDLVADRMRNSILSAMIGYRF